MKMNRFAYFAAITLILGLATESDAQRGRGGAPGRGFTPPPPPPPQITGSSSPFGSGPRGGN